jgi:hypothetical protein
VELSGVCKSCGQEKPIEAFRSFVLNGKFYRRRSCGPCIYARNKHKDKEYRLRRKEHIAAYHRERRQRCPDRCKHDRTCNLVQNYRRFDRKRGLSGTISLEDARALMKLQCNYCGTSESIGLDRVNNALGHTKENCIPSCKLCNLTRSDRFSVAEMRIIGRAVADVRQLRCQL